MFVIIDNDGKFEVLEKKYNEFKNIDEILIYYDMDVKYLMFEFQLVKKNGLVKVNVVLGMDFVNEDDFIEYMKL